MFRRSDPRFAADRPEELKVRRINPMETTLQNPALVAARTTATLASALIAHLSVGDGPEAWGWAAGTSVLWGLSYFSWRRLPASAWPRTAGS
jgi:hypothetical protein